MSNVAFAVKDGVATVELQRPEALNAVDMETKFEVIEQLEAYRDDDAVRAVVFRGEGDRAFCAGGDVTEVRELDYALEPFTESWKELFDLLTRMETPTVAAVTGVALGGGFDWLLHTDIVVAAEDASLGQPEVGLGIVNHFSPPMLLQQVGLRKTMELLLTGEPVSGREAERIGLVTRSVPAEEVDDEVERVVDSLREKSPRILGKVKRGVYASLDMSPTAAREHLERVALESARTDPDYREGVSAQLEDREPDWSE